MNISGIRPMVGYNQTNTAEVHRIDALLTDSTDSEAALTAQPAEVEAVVYEPSEVREAKRVRTGGFGMYDLQEQYRPSESISEKNLRSQLFSVEVQQAINDMKRDDLLHRYQTFAGNRPAAAATVIRGGEDFALVS